MCLCVVVDADDGAGAINRERERERERENDRIMSVNVERHNNEIIELLARSSNHRMHYFVTWFALPHPGCSVLLEC